MSEDPKPLGKFRLVTIEGLKSEAGQKLNGGRAIVLGKGAEVDGVTRFPVRIYADAEGTLLDQVGDKKIKSENLKPAEYDQLFWEAVKKFGLKSAFGQESGFWREDDAVGNKFKTPLFWLEAHHTLNPDNVRAGILYSNLLRADGQFDAAIKVMKGSGYFDKLIIDDPNFHLNCFDIAGTLATAKYQLHGALALALQIPQDAQEGLFEKVYDVLVEIRAACETLRHQDVQDEKPELSETHLGVAQILMERRPEDPVNEMAVAVAHCQAGNHLEGARIYRKVIAEGKLDPGRAERAKQCAIMAQLQCPGMPLENLYIITYHHPKFFVIQHSERHALRRTPEGDIKLLTPIEGPIEVNEFEGPTDPNDPQFFPASFLEQFQSAK